MDQATLPCRARGLPPTRLIGADTIVPCLRGHSRRYVNLDYAASTPVMAAVWDAVEAFVPWYSSVHRGSGWKSQVSTAAFEDARDTVAEFVGGHAHDAVVFVRNTTEAINVLSAAMPAGTQLYAPFGAGALVGDARLLGQTEPLLHGGGAIVLVMPDEVIWADAPQRHEAGSPNVVGAVALAAACRALLDLGMPTVAAHEQALSARLWSGLAGIPGLQRLTLWPDTADRVGVATFNLDGYRHPLLAAILSAEHAIGVRHGCFCAHPLITRLLGIPDDEIDRLATELRAGRRPALPGAVRASLGLGTTPHDIDRLIDALREIADTGPRSRYVHAAGLDEYHPEPHGVTAAHFGGTPTLRVLER
jgi:selenocysteine lyase/cysteine desulfurase